MPFRQITIIGTGLIGGSLGLALQEEVCRANRRLRSARRLERARDAAQSMRDIAILAKQFAEVTWWCSPRR